MEKLQQSKTFFKKAFLRKCMLKLVSIFWKQTLRISQKLFLSLALVWQIYDQYMSELFFCCFSLELYIWYFSEGQSHNESFQFIHSQISFICELLIAMLF